MNKFMDYTLICPYGTTGNPIGICYYSLGIYSRERKYRGDNSLLTFQPPKKETLLSVDPRPENKVSVKKVT